MFRLLLRLGECKALFCGFEHVHESILDHCEMLFGKGLVVKILSGQRKHLASLEDFGFGNVFLEEEIFEFSEESMMSTTTLMIY